MSQLHYEKVFSLPTGHSASAACVVSQYEGLSVTRQPVELGKREVEVEMNRRCIRYGEYVPVSESAARGDFVRMDFTGYLNGQPFDDGKVEGFDFQLGCNTFVPGFEEQIMERSAGESFEITVTFPEEYPAEELRGQECVFAIDLHEVRHFTVPAPSDDIAKKEGYADLAEMTEAVRQQRVRLHRAKEDEKLEGELLERVISSAETVISQPLMEFTVERLRKQLEQQLAASRTTMEKYLRRNSLTESDLEEQLRQRASKVIAKQLVIDGITEQEGLEPTDHEIESATEEYLKGAPRVRQRSPQLRALMTERVSCRKVGRFLLEHAAEV